MSTIPKFDNIPSGSVYYSEKCLQIQQDLVKLEQLYDQQQQRQLELLVPLTSGQTNIGFIKASIPTENRLITIQLTEDLYVKLKSWHDAKEILQRSLNRYKLLWLESLEEDNDLIGLQEFQTQFGMEVDSKQSLATVQKSDDFLHDFLEQTKQEQLFFEANNTSSS
jgi:hypothetical protein